MPLLSLAVVCTFVRLFPNTLDVDVSTAAAAAAADVDVDVDGGADAEQKLLYKTKHRHVQQINEN